MRKRSFSCLDNQIKTSYVYDSIKFGTNQLNVEQKAAWSINSIYTSPVYFFLWLQVQYADALSPLKDCERL